MFDMILAFVAAHGPMVFQVVGILVTAASGIVALTPSQKDDAILAKVVAFLDHFSVFNPKK